jgi:hypothetical protein
VWECRGSDDCGSCDGIFGEHQAIEANGLADRPCLERAPSRMVR